MYFIFFFFFEGFLEIVRFACYIYFFCLRKTAQKPLLRIMDYEILGRDLPVFGNPVQHSGNPNDYRGLNPNASVHNTRPGLQSPQKGGSNLGQSVPRNALFFALFSKSFLFESRHTFSVGLQNKLFNIL